MQIESLREKLDRDHALELELIQQVQLGPRLGTNTDTSIDAAVTEVQSQIRSNLDAAAVTESDVASPPVGKSSFANITQVSCTHIFRCRFRVLLLQFFILYYTIL